jgi:hypothetical protein
MTPHRLVIERAGRAARRLDELLQTPAMRQCRREFNAEYQSRRLAALARGQGFMTYVAAYKRFRRAVIRRLMSPGAVQGTDIHDEVFA